MKIVHKGQNIMICFKCSNEAFSVQTSVVTQDFRGETLQVTTPVSACQACGWETLAPGQTDELLRNTADTYRVGHGLLTSGEIVKRRTALGMSQKEFANFLCVGEASVKRWETWHVQDAGYDQLIRLKCDIQIAPISVILHYSGVVKFLPTGEWNAEVYYYNTPQPAWSRGATGFSLLNCRQTSARVPSTRTPQIQVSDADYDASTNIAAAA